MVHRREVDGLEIVLGNQGALWGRAMTWWDHDTGSIWSQPLGTAIAGPRRGRVLELLPSTLTTWETWRSAHPSTVALHADNGHSGFDLERMAIVVQIGEDAVAYPVPDLRRAGPANDLVGDTPVAVVVDPGDPDAWTVFSRALDDRTVTLAVDGTRLVDIETGSTWDPIHGLALDGPLRGQSLDRLPGFTSFPDDFHTFWPDGRLFSRS